MLYIIMDMMDPIIQIDIDNDGIFANIEKRDQKLFYVI